MVRNIRRGELYYVNLGVGIGSEQRGLRPCVIVQNNTGNKYSTTTIVAPITAQLKNILTHQTIELHKTSCIMYEQIRVVDKRRLRNKIGRLSKEQIKEMDEKIKISLGIK